MSRIGRAPIPIPSAVKVLQDGSQLAFEGPKGKLSMALPQSLSASVQESTLLIRRASDLKNVKALHGLYRALAANAVRGITEGFSKELEIIGVGYRAQVKGKTLELYVGFSHSVQFPIPEGITVETPKPTVVIVKGADRQLVGQVAANVRRIALPEPYKGKGIRYVGEAIRRKAGKAATGAKAGAGG
ncbi:MAG: 50S ribosomal protein L6 [Candidatus Omnitrophica bacterium]|nr:50S ribosomal protein L6 [Candidatus Omnitrophota bacterium]